MNKKFYFALALTAGLFASCSSDEVALAPQANLDDSQKAPIELKLGSLGNVTRGTGTVGSLAGAGDNVWAGQKFNVYMFDKGTLTLAQDELGNAIYDNQEFASPNVLAGMSADASAKVIAAAGTAYGTGTPQPTVQNPNPDGLTLTEVNGYFPQAGNFDFWAYRLDGAETAAPTIGATEVTVPFTITGSEDIMVAKATPTEALNAADASHPDAFYTVGGEDIPEPQVYSAYAARRGMHPHLNFQHLLTRLQFKVKSTEGLSQKYDNAAAGTLGGNAVNPSAVRVKSISVNCKASGTLTVAYTGAAPASVISFTDGSETDLVLQQRAREVKTPATLKWTTNLYSHPADGTYSETLTKTNLSTETVTSTGTLMVFADKTDVDAAGIPQNGKTITDALTAGWTEFYAYIVDEETVYGEPDIAANLVALEPVTPRWDMSLATPAAYPTPVGEALLVAPATQYDLTVVMEQDVPELTQTISWKDVHNDVLYYFNSIAERDNVIAAYNAWANLATPFDAGTAEETAYTTALTANNASTTEIKVVLKSSTKTTPKVITLKGPKTVTAAGETYAPFETNKTYTVNITLNGLENVSSDTEITGYEDGGEVDIEN